MKALITLLISIIAEHSFCCSCITMKNFEKKDDLKEYNFIAMVTIKKLAPYNMVNKAFHLRTNGEIKFEILEQFKGGPIELANDYSYNTDCAMYLKEGEQWLLFGSITNGKVNVDRCGYSVQYRDSTGLREWGHFNGIKQLDVLRKIYGHPLISNPTKKQFYPNGNIEVEQTFKNGKLDGLRKIYYPDGKIYITEKFKNGVRVDFRDVYRSNGQLQQHVVYKNNLIAKDISYQDTTEIAWWCNYQIHHHNDMLFGDKIHDTTYYINKLDSLRHLSHWDRQIASIKTYSLDGMSYTFKSYDYKGDIKITAIQNWKKQINETFHYRENGKMEYYSLYNHGNNQQIEYDYAENGSRKDFLSECDYCKFYFAKDLPPAAAPEKIYIQ